MRGNGENMKEIKIKKKNFNSVGEFRNNCGCLCSCGYETPYQGSYNPTFERAYQSGTTPWSTNK